MMGLHLSLAQRRVVNHGDGPLLVVAGPGSGKTRVLTERIRRLLTVDQGHFRILALTFTNKAANEMKERLAEFPDIDQRAFVGTLHSFCMEVIMDRGKPVGIDGLPSIFESYADRQRLLFQAAMEDPELVGVLKQFRDAREQGRLLGRWLGMIDDAKNNLLLPEMLREPVDRKVYEVYNDALRASSAVDFGDLLLLTYRLFTERPRIADFYRRQYAYICIDEAQDINEAQYRVLCALCGSEYSNIMVVGDPKQAIFVWNGADPKYLDLFHQEFGADVISLSENFRSSQAVVNAAKCLNPDYEVEGQLPVVGRLQFLEGDNEEHEARMVLDAIGRLTEDGHADVEGDITLERCALLGRTRYVLSAVEEELGKRGWPYYKQLSAEHHSESELLLDLELCLRILANPRDRLHLGMLLNRWSVIVDVTALTKDGLAHSIFNALSDDQRTDCQRAVLQAITAVEWTEQDFKFDSALDCLDRFAALSESDEERALIMQDIREWRKHWEFFLRSQPGGQHSLSTFLSQVALGTTQQPRQQGLALLTIHSAKGLEFDVVFVMGMAEGTFPDYRATGAASEEERRNAFVAVTRSKRLLGLSYPKTRVMPWGDTKIQRPSRYLRTLGLIKA